jgi:hypothetical protein
MIAQFGHIAPYSPSLVSFLLDSGANACLTGDRSLLGDSPRQVSIPVEGISGALQATLVGAASLTLSSGDFLEISRLFYVPGLSRTLLSTGALVEDGYTFRSSKSWPSSKCNGNNLTVVTRGSFSVTLPCVNLLYQFIGPQTLQMSANSATVLAGKGLVDSRGNPLTFAELMHQRCGHVSWGSRHLEDAFSKAYPKANFSAKDMPVCDACI